MSDIQPNILFIVLDTARARTTLPMLREEQMPATSSIASEGLTFTNASSVAPWTLPSHASMFTGEYTSQHGTHAGNQQFTPSHPPLAERFSAAGYHTAMASSNPWITPEFGFDRGFDDFTTQYDVAWNDNTISNLIGVDGVGKQIWQLLGRASRFPSRTLQYAREVYSQQFGSSLKDSGAQRLRTRSVEWMSEHLDAPSPWFLFVNFTEPHLPYDPPEEYIAQYLPEWSVDRIRETNQDPWLYITDQVEMSSEDFEILRGLYRASLAYLDSQLARLYDFLRDSNALDDTLIILVGDHGENIGEHGLMDHQYSLHETLLHVPLVLRFPPEIEPGSTDRLIETRDLFPTLLNLANVSTQAPESSSGVNLLRDNREFVMAEYVSPQPSMDALKQKVGGQIQPGKSNRALKAIKTEDWKLIQASTSEKELYSINENIADCRNVAPKKPRVCSDLSNTLSERLGVVEREQTPRDDVNEVSKQRLEDLGYI